jgi:hypothetical protein
MQLPRGRKPAVLPVLRPAHGMRCAGETAKISRGGLAAQRGTDHLTVVQAPAAASPDAWNLLPPGFGDGAGPSLDPTVLGDARAIESWLLTNAVRLDKAEAVLMGLAERLNALGIPVDRITTAIEALHSDYAGVGRFWSREEGATVRLFPHGERGELIYRHSPFAYVHATRRWLLRRRRAAPGDPVRNDPARRGEPDPVRHPVRRHAQLRPHLPRAEPGAGGAIAECLLRLHRAADRG